MVEIIRFKVFCFVSLFLVVLCFFSVVYAQEPQEEGSEKGAMAEVAAAEEEAKYKTIPSLFFTYWQHQSILDAKNSRGAVRPPTQAELDALARGDVFEPAPSIREISLGGIVYDGPEDWTIWLNEQRVTPDAVPREVLSLEVFKDYIEVKWVDDYTNQVFPLRLRAHQRFNLDQRIFLMGE